MRLSILLFIVFIFAVSARSFSSPMHFVHLKAKNAEERSEIAKYIHIDSIIEDDVYAVVNDFDYIMLKKVFKNKLVTSHRMDTKAPEVKGLRDYEFPNNHAAYHTYDDLLETLAQLEERFPELVEYSTLGKTLEGRDIPLFRITKPENRYNDYFTPGIFFVGSHHAREHLSTEIPLKLIQYLLENYENDDYVRNLINTRDIYIAPTLNVDGKLHDIKDGRFKMWRKNRKPNDNGSFGVDLNRNYSYGWGTGGSSTNPNSDVYMGPEAFSEPETQAVRDFVVSHPNIRILLTYHTYSELILYPWGGSKDDVLGEDGEIFVKMAEQMSQWNDYRPMPASDLYIASGDTCDWAYGSQGIYCFTFELSPGRWGGTFYPGDIIDETFEDNVGSALYLIDYSDDPSRVLSEEYNP